MQREVKAFLSDTLHAAHNIETFTLGIRFETYTHLDETRWAVERGFEISGEAARHAIRIHPSTEALLPKARQMIAFRSVLIHDYAVTRDEQVWDTIKINCPA